MAKLYYIQDTRDTVGNCASWWRPNSCGYTTQIEEAGLYSEEEAKKITSHRSTDIAWPKEVVEHCAVRHVRVDHLRKRIYLLTNLQEDNDAK